MTWRKHCIQWNPVGVTGAGNRCPWGVTSESGKRTGGLRDCHSPKRPYSETAVLRNCRTPKLTYSETARLRDCPTATLPDSETARLRNYPTPKLPDSETVVSMLLASGSFGVRESRSSEVSPFRTSEVSEFGSLGVRKSRPLAFLSARPHPISISKTDPRRPRGQH